MIDKEQVEIGARLAAEATPGPWWVSHHPDNVEHFIEPEVGNIDEDNEADAAFIAHWNPEFATELVRELQRLWRVEGAAREFYEAWSYGDPALDLDTLADALANPAAEAGE